MGSEKAEKLLLTTGKSISEISLLCGFSDPKYIYKSFKKWYDVTPSAHKKAYEQYMERGEGGEWGGRSGERGRGGGWGERGNRRERTEQERGGGRSPFHSESGMLDCCQVTVGWSLDKMLTWKASVFLVIHERIMLGHPLAVAQQVLIYCMH